MAGLLGAFPGSPPSSIPPSKPSLSLLVASTVFEASKSLPASSVSRRLKIRNPSSSPPSEICAPAAPLLGSDASVAGYKSSSPVSSVGRPERLRGLSKSSWCDCVQSPDDSSQPPLKFFPPSKVDGDVAVISPPAEVLNQMEAFRGVTLVGYFGDKPPHFHAINYIARKIWAKFGLSHVAVNPCGFFFFRFTSSVKMNLCFQNGPWTLAGRPISLKIWSPGIPLVKEHFDSWPIWISLRNVPVEFWSPIGLSWIASSVGKPLLLHPHTAKLERLFSARVCVEVKFGSSFPSIVRLRLGPPGKSGLLPEAEVQVVYPRSLVKCSNCHSFGHRSAHCCSNPLRHPSKGNLPGSVPVCSAPTHSLLAPAPRVLDLNNPVQLDESNVGVSQLFHEMDELAGSYLISAEQEDVLERDLVLIVMLPWLKFWVIPLPLFTLLL